MGKMRERQLKFMPCIRYTVCMKNEKSVLFDEAYGALNPEQRKAVDSIFGPILVVAGPGTGKTQVLALRIANILKKTDVHPSNILALTFTENGALSMRKRLLRFIGPDAHSVEINTFHGFCQDVIAEFSEKFLFARKLEPIDDVKRIEILRDIVMNLELPLLKPVKSPLSNLKSIQGAISSLKREGITPEHFEEMSIEERKGFESLTDEETMNPKTGKMKEKYAQVEKRTAKYFELRRVFADYERKLRIEGLYDFEDMIDFVVSKMKVDNDLLWTLRERYQFLLADEFQDTNGRQMSLLELFAGDDENPNIFAVGDDDQAIYRFQGASLENILHFQKRFPKTLIIAITENYRSTKNILSVAQAVIENNSERLVKNLPGLDKNLKAVSNQKSTPVETVHFSHAEDEHHFIMHSARKLHDDEKIPWGEIAVLVRTNAEGFALLDLFQREKIPVSFSGFGNAFDDPYVRKIIRLLTLVLNPEDDGAFFECLHYDFFEIPTEAVWNVWDVLKTSLPGTKGKLWKCARMMRENPNILEYFVSLRKDGNTEHEKTAKIPDAMQKFCRDLLRWEQDIRNLSLVESVQKILTESGLLEYLLRHTENAEENKYLPGNLDSLNAVNAFFHELVQYSKGNFQSSLSGFQDRIHLREEFSLALPERDIHSSPDALQLLTAHKAKGLEFEAVYIVHGNSGIWGGRKNPARIALPEGILEYSHAKTEDEEERRLFFVACTRAKSKLTITFSDEDANGRTRAESRFVSEIPIALIEERDGGKKMEVRGASIFRERTEWKKNNGGSPLPKDFLEKALDPAHFSLSHSAFENYRENPLKFLWEDVLGIPSAKAPGAVLGTALHRALEIFYSSLPEEKIQDAEKAFEERLKRECLTEDEFRDIKSRGLQILRLYLHENSGKFPEPYRIEYNFRPHRVLLDGKIPITGKVDLIEWISKERKTVKITDFKTMKPKSENEIRGIRESDQGDISAGRYYRQLVFYSLLADFSSTFSDKAELFSLSFLEPTDGGKLKTIDFFITEEEKEALKKEIQEVWKRIQALDFTPKTIHGDPVKGDVLSFLFPSLAEDSMEKGE